MPHPKVMNHEASAAELRVPMTDVVRFVRQLSHDLRNHLNAVELQSAYLKEIIDDAEAKAEIQRLRAMISELGTNLQKVTTLIAPVKLTRMPYDASAFMEDLRNKVEAQFAEHAAEFEWQTEPTTATLEIDPQLLQQAMLELVDNALQHSRGPGKIAVASSANDHEFTITFREQKAAFEQSMENWGREPFKLLKHGHYGLGLHRVRSIIEAHDGKLTASYDSAGSALVTTVSVPLGNAG